jgi:hypothetical protein
MEFVPKIISEKEKRIRSITSLYYSKEDVQKAIFEFCRDRETIPRFFEGFGKRPDSLQYPNDVFELAKKGATSFHCSEEIWKDPLKIETGMSEAQANGLRKGWDLLIDIDSKYIDYSKIFAELTIDLLRFHGIKNVGIKFSGSKGFHIIVPWKAFPKEIAGENLSDGFPEYPRIITNYIAEKTKTKLIERVSELSKPNKYVKDFQAPKEVIPDLILVSPRHLFRAPYSLHEKTSLASVVLDPDEIKNFELKQADPLKIKIKNFIPNCEEEEASELLREALDWFKHNHPEKQEKVSEFKQVKIEIKNISEKNFPPSIQKILLGLSDGRKRGLFVLLNFFRSIGMEKDELEKRIYEWNSKNEIPLKEGYVKIQISWSYQNKIVFPPNFDKDYYKGIGIVPTEEELRYKNPVTYMVKKSFSSPPKKFSKKNK